MPIEERTKTLVEQNRLAGKAILEALGLDPNKIRSFTMSFALNDVPHITVEYIRNDLWESQDTLGVAAIVASFSLVPKD